jgi:hypothetical protein
MSLLVSLCKLKVEIIEEHSENPQDLEEMDEKGE